MPDDTRLDFDAPDDMEQVKNDLLKDVKDATRQAKQRKADDKARDAELATKGRDRTLMYIISAVAAVVILVIAYFVTFGGTPKAGAPQPSATESHPTTTYQPRQQYVQPAPTAPAPPSEPTRRTPTDTYDEGPSTGRGM